MQASQSVTVLLHQYTLSFYKNMFYNNVEAEICEI